MIRRDDIFLDLIVKHGPFEGMKYPEEKAIGSSLAPKLIGSYERELHPVIDKICSIPYDTIINIGCGEGYYAVGLAMKIPTSKVFTYDIDPEASRLCASMAEINKVSDRVEVHTRKYDQTLLPVSKKGLIICDCEGGEQELFTEDFGSQLAHWDLIVEAHDFVTKEETSKYLQQLFKSTHDIEVVKSISDNEKSEKYIYPELENCDKGWVRGVFAENRPVIMEWVVAFAKGSHNGC